MESARADMMVASSKNYQLLSQLKGNQVAYGALVEELREMREELGEQKRQFCKQVAELQSNLSAVCSKRDATVCLCENTQVDAELFQSQVERLECERCELTVSSKHRNWLAAWICIYLLSTVTKVACLHKRDGDDPLPSTHTSVVFFYHVGLSESSLPARAGRG